MQTQNSQVAQGLQIIEALDFERLLNRLQSPAPRGKEWTAQQAIEADKWYRRFLILSLKYPDMSLVPSAEVDELWHLHILDMKRYETETVQIFGHVFYHKPNFNEGDLRPQIEKTHELLLAEFGESFDNKTFTATCTSDCSCRPNITMKPRATATCDSMCNGTGCNSN